MAIVEVSRWLLMAVCLFAMTDALNFGRIQTMNVVDDSSEIDVKTMQSDEAIATLQKLQQLFDAIKENGDDCSCTGLTCQCCADIKVKRFDAKFCLNLSFDPNAGTATISGTIDGHTVFRETFQVSKPIPPLCFDYKLAKICLEFYDFHVDSKAVKGCARITVKVLGKKFNIKVGCFNVKFLDALAPSQLAWFPVVKAETVVDSFEGGAFYVLGKSLVEGDQSIDDGNES